MLSTVTPEQVIGYFAQLDSAGKKDFMSLLKEYLNSRKEDVAPQTLEEYNLELEKADAEIEAGDFILHEDVVKYFSKTK